VYFSSGLFICFVLGPPEKKRYKHTVLSDEKHFKMVPLLGGCAKELVAAGASTK
jgi:hypothetical protein